MGDNVPLVITGAGGKLGRLLRCLWPAGLDARLAPVWYARNSAIPGVFSWNMGVDAAPDLPPGAVILHLAGSVTTLAEYRASTLAICAAARESGARHLFVASSGAVYRPQAEDNREDTPPDPPNAYGAAKLAAEAAARAAMAEARLTLLRIGNIAGADALLGGNAAGRPVKLDPVAGQNGPERSYIGPTLLAGVFSRLAARAVEGAALPMILNVAQPGRIAMGDLLDAAGREWSFGAPNPAVLPRLTLNTERLAALLPLPAASAPDLVADLAGLQGRWP
jgi:nucleoside-diphosphate-sugar epimerase